MLLRAALGVLLLALFPAAVSAESRPDIVVVMVDDLGAMDERVLERLPNIRSLFLDGLRFDQMYTELPLCCPSRAAFLTGQHGRNNGVVNNSTAYRDFDPSRTIATALNDSGYWTVQVGKYLNKSGLMADPTPPGWDRVAMSHDGGLTSTWQVQGGPRERRGFHDRWLIHYTMAELERVPDGAPLFMWVNIRAPHARSNDRPWLPVVERKYAGDRRCSGIAPWKHPGYDYAPKPNGFPLGAICRSLLTGDELVGKLRAQMAAQGRDPIYLFLSDNGMAWGWHGFPLKVAPEADRLPMYVTGPGVRSGATAALLSNIDIAPTLADLAGTSLPWADGSSFASLLTADGPGREWMVEDSPATSATYGPWDGPWKAVRTPEWYLLWRKDTGRLYLYDLLADPWRNRDVADTHPDVVDDLKVRLP